MNKLLLGLILLVMLCGSASSAEKLPATTAKNGGTAKVATATDTVHFSVTPILELAVTSGPQTLTINTVAAGSDPNDALGVGSYAITANVNSKILAKIDSNMPTGTTLNVMMGAVGGGSPKSVSLSSTDQIVQAGITPVAAAGINIIYTFSANHSAGNINNGVRTVTYTLTSN